MRGPAILARTMSIPTVRGRSTRPWQYHSRSDSHSKVACWAVLFDLMRECDVFRSAVSEGRIGFGINYVIVGPINKTLDLVVTRVPPTRPGGPRGSFVDLANEWGIALNDEERQELADMPTLLRESSNDIAEIAIALEAKACMTEHVKSLPRLHAEILATGYLTKRAAPQCISVSYSLVNAASDFVTPSGESRVNSHDQPDDARRVVEMIERAIPTLTESRDYGYDVVGVTVVSCRNDGSAVTIVQNNTIGPAPNQHHHYERMIRSLCSQFRGRFGR